MEMLHAPTTTRNDVGYCYHCHASPQIVKTDSAGLFHMSPNAYRELSYQPQQKNAKAWEW